MAGSTLPVARVPLLPDGSLDPSAFSQQWRVYALQVPPKLTQRTVAALKDHVLRVPRVAAVAKSDGPQSDRVVLLRYFAVEPPDIPFSPRGNMVLSLTGKSSEVVEKMKNKKLGSKVGADVEMLLQRLTEDSLLQSVVDLTYDHWPAEAILGRILPTGTIMYAMEHACLGFES